MDVITTTLKRELFAQIVAGTKRVEYQEIKPYWTKRQDYFSEGLSIRWRVPTIATSCTTEYATTRSAAEAKATHVEGTNDIVRTPT